MESSGAVCSASTSVTELPRHWKKLYCEDCVDTTIKSGCTDNNETTGMKSMILQSGAQKTNFRSVPGKTSWWLIVLWKRMNECGEKEFPLQLKTCLISHYFFTTKAPPPIFSHFKCFIKRQHYRKTLPKQLKANVTKQQLDSVRSHKSTDGYQPSVDVQHTLAVVEEVGSIAGSAQLGSVSPEGHSALKSACYVDSWWKSFVLFFLRVRIWMALTSCWGFAPAAWWFTKTNWGSIASPGPKSSRSHTNAAASSSK